MYVCVCEHAIYLSAVVAHFEFPVRVCVCMCECICVYVCVCVYLCLYMFFKLVYM